MNGGDAALSKGIYSLKPAWLGGKRFSVEGRSNEIKIRKNRTF
jgi:hypothetical protein